ncbi:acyl carrier protein [Clostridium beijerinckii]|uniref:acyl carrier protein n=1 Tax=Clostridium beijerinckii TaxID=1520 RepID=UPI0022E4B3BD|nr:acyl carrier protein [Clostridium beijerinckii]
MKEITIEKVLEIVNSIMEKVVVTKEELDDDLEAMGMNSIMFIRIVISFEEELECEVPDSKLLISEMNTVNKMFDVLTSIENLTKV